MADKLEIDGIVRGLGFKHVIAGVPTDAGTVDDLFCKQLGDTPYAPWTFSEFTDWNLREGLPVFSSYLNTSVKMKESHREHRPLIDLAPGHKLTGQFLDLHAELEKTLARAAA